MVLYFFSMPRQIDVDTAYADLTPPKNLTSLQPGPTQAWAMGTAAKQALAYGDMEDLYGSDSHRKPPSKELLAKVQRLYLTAVGIPSGQQNNFEIPEGRHGFITSSGSQAIEMIVQAACDAELGHDNKPQTIVVDTDEFAKGAAQIMGRFGRPARLMQVEEKGTGLVRGSKEFDELVRLITSEAIRTIWLVKNGTTTGIYHDRESLEVLAELCRKHGNHTLLFSDEVSAPIFARENPQAMNRHPHGRMTSGQKHPGIFPGIAFGEVDGWVLRREKELAARGVFTGAKLGLQAAIGSGEKPMASDGQTMQTPPTTLILRAKGVLTMVIDDAEIQRQIAAAMKNTRRLLEESAESGILRDRGVRFAAKPGFRSPTTNVLHVPGEIGGAKKVIAEMEKAGFALATGYVDKFTEVRLFVSSALTSLEAALAVTAFENAVE